MIHYFQYKKENYPKLSQICSYEIFSKGLKNEFEIAVVYEPSVFEPLNVFCSLVLVLVRLDNFGLRKLHLTIA